MTKGYLIEFIRKLIHDAAVEQLRKKKMVSPHEAPKLSDDELDTIFFYGGMDKGEARPFGIRESFGDTAKINASDITAFEQQMQNMIGNIPNAVLTFDQQRNGHSIMLKNEGSASAVASGKVSFGGEGDVKWMFSMTNGFRMQTDGLKITSENKDVITEMANYYETWQKDWRQKLLAPDGGEGQNADQQQPGQDFNSTPGAPAQGGEMPTDPNMAASNAGGIGGI